MGRRLSLHILLPTSEKLSVSCKIKLQKVVNTLDM